MDRRLVHIITVKLGHFQKAHLGPIHLLGLYKYKELGFTHSFPPPSAYSHYLRYLIHLSLPLSSSPDRVRPMHGWPARAGHMWAGSQGGVGC